MATEIPRPGTEVVQEFASTAPTIVTPTLVPCIIAPFFEVIEVLNADGTVNEDSKLTDLYEQFEMSISQSSFPSPRGNIDEVDVLEDEIRAFFDFGGAITELSQESGFLTWIDVATEKSSVTGTTTGPFSVDGLKLVLQYDSHTGIPPAAGNFLAANDKTVTFAATVSGGTLTIDEVVAQINALVPGLASSDSGSLKLTSLVYGASGSVMVRYQGSSANSALGFSTSADEYAVNPGLYAADDNDSDFTSPRLEVYEGRDQAGSAIITAPNFIDASILAGDSVVADGVAIGDVAVVTSTRLTMEVEQNIMSHDNPFAPRYVWLRANELTYPAPSASSAATQTGTVQTSAATQAYIVGATVPSLTISAGQSFEADVTIGGVAQDTETIVAAADWTNLTEVVDGINAAATNFEAYKANKFGDEASSGTYLGLRTKADNTGSGAGITYVSGTSGMTLGITDAASDVGENIRFLSGSKPIATSSAPVASTAGTETVTYIPTVGGAAQSAETVNFGVNADLDAVVADWNANTLYTEAYKSTSAGVESSTGTYLSIRTLGENFGTGAIIDVTVDAGSLVGGVATHTGTDTDLDGQSFKWSIDYNPKEYEAIFVADEDDGGTSLQSVLNKINELTPGVASASSDSPPFLKITSQKVGEASEMEVTDGDANANLGFSDDTSTTGNGRPAPDLAIGTAGEVILQGQLLRNGLTGIPYDPGFSPLHIAYRGLRLDMSPDAVSPGLISITDTDSLEDIADPISLDNPGSLMCYLAKLNAPTTSITAIGVPEVSADAPTGTPAGYTKCFEFLQNEEVYALAMATQEAVVHQTSLTHVTSMSQPEQKGERITIFNPPVPDRASPSTVGSGTDANSTVTQNELTIEVNIAPALIAAGIDPDEDINPTSGAIENEVYVDLGSDDKYYLVQAVDNGTILTLRTSFSSGDGNEDSFYSSTVLPSGIISDNWTVYIRGEELLIPGSTQPDKDGIAETVQGVGLAYGNRRGYMVVPDQCGINVSGLEQVVDGYYATACVAGMIGELAPQQGFTNYPITGLTRVVGSNDFFTNTQMNVMAAGGAYILVQDTEGAAVSCRHQLSTDMTSIETRELSITKDIDYCAKFLRIGLRNYIGRSNITQPFLDNLSTVLQGLVNFLEENFVIIGGNINNLIQDADNPDTVLVDVTLDVPYPCNYVRIVLII